MSIRGLKKSPQHNGSIGIIKSLDPNAAWAGVRLSLSLFISVKYVNLQWPALCDCCDSAVTSGRYFAGADDPPFPSGVSWTLFGPSDGLRTAFTA